LKQFSVSAEQSWDNTAC